MKYDLYDFDGTIYDGDSGVDLVKFAIKKNPKFLLKFPKIAWYSLKFFLNIGTKEEAKNHYNQIKSFENYNLIVIEYLASSGSDMILEPVAMFNERRLNINIPIKKAEIGTCDLKSHQICILITKDIFELRECDNYLVRFIEE
jgi:hypothetical protein